MNSEFILALEQLEKEKGISKEVILESLDAALVAAYKKNFDSADNVEVTINRTNGEVKVFAKKQIVEEVLNENTEMSLQDAQKINKTYNIGDVAEIEVTPRDFGRIAAQTGKQVVVQRIREAERNVVYEQFANREGDIVTGIITRIEKKNIVIDLGKVEAILGPSEQVANEVYNIGDRIKTYIVEVKKAIKGGFQVVVSRTHPGLVKRLFELEVPEIYNGTIEIKAIAREAGSRTKMSVLTKEENIDPVGSCVGQRGTRVEAVVNELNGEKIDIIQYSADPAQHIASSLSPAKVVAVDINEEEKMAKVVVPDFQLSLAIGKEGQNARLAARLTGWRIDIKSESQIKEMLQEY